MPRIARLLALNYPHHITQRGNNQGSVFFDDKDRKFYLRTISKYGEQWKFDMWAYCLMPNHVHLLVVPRKEESLARGIGATNLVYTQYFNQRYARKGRLWQNRFFSTVVDRESYLWSVVRYIERNPVRANMVKSLVEYPWSSARAHMLGERNDILSGESWLEKNEFGAYREFLRGEDKKIEDSIRKATSTGRPLGSGEFIIILEKILERNIFPKKAGRPKKK